MTGRNYPANWKEICHDVCERHMNRCVNCRRIADPAELEVHHIVPIGHAGSHRQSNLVPLCRQCHRAAHGEQKAPRIRWYTNGNLSPSEFGEHKRLWKQLRQRFGVPRYDPDDESVYIPIADVERVLTRLEI